MEVAACSGFEHAAAVEGTDVVPNLIEVRAVVVVEDAKGLVGEVLFVG